MSSNPNYRFLTYKEKQIIDVAKQRGYIFLADCGKIYASKTNMKNALQRLFNMGFLVEDIEVFGKFNYVYYKEQEQKELGVECENKEV